MNPNKLDPLSRRQFVERAAQATFGVTVLHSAGQLVQAAEATGAVAGAAPGLGKGKRCIFLQMVGGMTHIDTLDPKEGPTQGPVAPVATKAGFQLGGTMVKLAEQAGKISLVRSMSSKTGVHAAGQYVIRTGYEQRGTIKHPSIGAWAQHFQGSSHKTLPATVCVNRQPGGGNGFFPASFAPLPILDPDSGLQNSEFTVPTETMTKRMALLDKLDSGFRSRFQTLPVKSYTEFYENTMRIMSSEDLKAFSIEDEPAELREKYGMNKLGQGMLLARRLIEKGVRVVEVAGGGWDMHNTIDEALQDRGAELDQGLAALLEDLSQRGLLDSTLVVLCSEFGRTPKINQNGGRDHYPKAFSTLLAGGGIKGGFVYGSTDKAGAEVADKQATIQDFISTIGHSMGLPVEEVVMSPSNRPFTVGDKGKPILELFA